MKKALWILVVASGLAFLLFLGKWSFRPSQAGLADVGEEGLATGGGAGTGGAGFRASAALGGSPAGALAHASGGGQGMAGEAVLARGFGARAQAFQAWQTLMGAGAVSNPPAALDRTLAFKAAFDRLDPEDQLDGIRMALQLLTDEQFPLLYAILFDMAQPPAVLDAIFSDGLNRPEDVKGSMLRVLLADRKHPMFFESARILDVMGQLNPEPSDAEAAQENEEQYEGEPPG